MSHLPERKEKNCLNCGTTVRGRYCHNCGQENIEPKESVWDLVTHFFHDITHFDGKFFSSLKLLIKKPGFLTREYVAGRRARYLNPVRMYLFTSAIFFLIFFSLYKVDEKSLSISSSGIPLSNEQIDKMDSAKLADVTKRINNGIPIPREQLKERMKKISFNIGPGNYKSKKEYDSLLKAGVKKHNWLQRQLIYKNIELNEKYKGDGKLILVALIDRFMHSIPQMLFFMLPLFALILKLVYIRRKQFYYVDHIIFTIHLYIFIFMVMLVTFGISKLKSVTGWGFLNFIGLVFVLAVLFYFYKALRNFYKQRRAKTVLKYFILLISFLSITVLTFLLFFFFSAFSL